MPGAHHGLPGPEVIAVRYQEGLVAERKIKIVLGLKTIQRKGWKDKLGLKNVESVADHSYSMTIMSMVLSDLLALDTNKILKMALLQKR